MTKGSITIGYHGCDRELGERVLAGEVDLKTSSNDYDWLADGVYLWENDAQRGMHWARTLQKHRQSGSRVIREPFVIGVVVELGNCLDLLQTDSIALVATAYAELKQMLDQSGLPMPANRIVRGELALRRLDCAVIRFLHQKREEIGLPPFDTIRAAFPEGRALYPGAGFQERTHIQLCVRHSRQIVGYFRVKR